MFSTVWTSSGVRSPRDRVLLRRLSGLLVRDELRHRPPVTLPGRPAVVRESSTLPQPSRPPAVDRGAPHGTRSERRPSKLNSGDAGPEDFFGLYTRAQLVRMDQRFTKRMERAFRRGAEHRDAARATYRAGRL
jgi:hypothetical protein